MKISRLYLKILFSFILVQLVAMLTILTCVHMGLIRPPFIRHAEERTIAIKELVAHEIGEAQTITPATQQELSSMLHIFVKAFQGYAWITDAKGDIVARSFTSSIPLTGQEAIEETRLDPDGNYISILRRNRDREESIHSIGRISAGGTTLTINLLHKWKKHREERWLTEGLLFMASIAALLLIPISRRISKPIKQLTDSAEQIGRGDFSPRVPDIRKDEVGTLARTFNHMAESLEKMVRGGKELTANLSHELRSPLARIRISQQIIQERMESGRTDGVGDHIQKMEAEIDHMDGLIDKILKLSKLDLQEAPRRDDHVNIASMLEQAVDRQQPSMEKKNVSMTRDTGITPQYPCSAEHLRMAVDNVLTNAVKYSAEGGTIATTCYADDEAITIQVTNPYQELSQGELETVFIPFKRLGYDDVEGNGLGLAFARKIVEDHGGTMEAANAKNGFCMTIRLPLTT